jgi:hypothetical protein
MAQKVQVILIDDIDGSRADETVTFSLDGANYEIDLTSRRAAELRAALAPWIASARRANARPTRAARRGSGDVQAIRAWARSHGHAVNERGRISAELRAAYEAANR